MNCHIWDVIWNGWACSFACCGQLARSFQTLLTACVTSGSPLVKPSTSSFQRAASACALGDAGSSPALIAACTSAINSVHCLLTRSCSSGDHSPFRASIFVCAASLAYFLIQSLFVCISITSMIFFEDGRARRSAGSDNRLGFPDGADRLVEQPSLLFKRAALHAQRRG